MMKIRIALILAFFQLYSSETEAQEIVAYPAPSGAPTTESYAIKVNGISLPVYIGTGARYPYYFCYFDMNPSKVHVEVTSATFDLTEVHVRPASCRIFPEATSEKAVFTIDKIGSYVLVPSAKGYQNPIHIFANSKEINPPTEGSANLVYFGPGVHQVNNLVLSNNQTLYIHGSAYLKGGITVTGKNNVKIGIGN